MPLRAKISFIVTGVRRNNGIIEALFSLVGGLPDEYVRSNLFEGRGVPVEGERYRIIIEPEFPHEI